MFVVYWFGFGFGFLLYQVYIDHTFCKNYKTLEGQVLLCFLPTVPTVQSWVLDSFIHSFIHAFTHIYLSDMRDTAVSKTKKIPVVMKLTC